MSITIPILQLQNELERKLHKSKSESQARLMQAVAHNPEFAEKVDIPQSVGREFVDADKTAHEQQDSILNAISEYEQKYDIDLIERIEDYKDKACELFSEYDDELGSNLRESLDALLAIIKSDIAQSPRDFVEKTTHSQTIEPQQAERPEPIHFELNGLPITIENQAGTVRKGTDKAGNDWAVQLKSHYGEIRGSVGADGDYVDCFINPDYLPDEQSIDDPVFIVNQADPYTDKFDEVKVMIGYDSLEQAKVAYAENYEDGWPEQEIIETDYYELTDWLNSSKSTEEFEDDNTDTRY